MHAAIYKGRGGFPGGSTLTRLLAEHLGDRILGNSSPLSIPQILAWGNAYRVRTGRWPSPRSGPVAEVPRETWCAIQFALGEGLRGLTGGSSLARLFIQERKASEARESFADDSRNPPPG